jgi:hypothetical protein
MISKNGDLLLAEETEDPADMMTASTIAANSASAAAISPSRKDIFSKQ